MFTGLVEELGNIRQIESSGSFARLSVQCNVVGQDAAVGDSIAVNGCCLTAVAVDHQCLEFEAVQETLQRTNLGELNEGDNVNLERAMRPTDRLGGHYVTGHIDAVAAVSEITDGGEWQKFWFDLDRGFIDQLASKGSVAVDGVSLTLVDVTDDQFSVVLIPHTLQVTTLGQRRRGDRVNVETDLLAKYVKRQLEFLREAKT